jgi:hypothetical protein
MENGTSILFGLPGVAADRFERGTGEHGELVRLIHVVTTASSAAGCPHGMVRQPQGPRGASPHVSSPSSIHAVGNNPIGS